MIASTDTTAENLARAGFLWHGDYNDEDLPRLVHTDAGTIVALPHTDFADNRVLRQNPRAYFDVYKDTFDYLHAHEPGALINLTIHCQFGGRPLIAAMFADILQYLTGFPDVWFPRHDALARWFRDSGIDKVPYAARFFPELSP